MRTAQDALVAAFAEVGTVEKPDNLTKYGHWNGTDGQPWCGAFVRWVMARSTVGVKIPNCTYTPTGAQGFKDLGRWHDKGDPKPGDVIFFDFPHDGIDRISHVGIVVRAEPNGDVFTIEGNTSSSSAGDQRNGGCVAIKRRTRKEIVGWGRPEYKDAPTPVVPAIVDFYQDHKVKPVPAPPAPKPAPAKKAAAGKPGKVAK